MQRALLVIFKHMNVSADLSMCIEAIQHGVYRHYRSAFEAAKKSILILTLSCRRIANRWFERTTINLPGYLIPAAGRLYWICIRCAP